MKLSKKLVAIFLVVAMVTAQVSVLPFAGDDYASGRGDGTFYAMKVPEATKVNTNWISTANTVGKSETSESTYASAANKSHIYIADGFFKMTPNSSANGPAIRFWDNSVNTYGTTGYGVDSSITGITGMLFRVKNAIGQTAYLEIGINANSANKGNLPTHYKHVVTNDLKFIDAATGAVSDLTYDTTNKGIGIANNADGYIYAPLSGIVNGSAALTFAELSTGYKGIQYKVQGKFGDENKTFYIGDVFFSQSLDAFKAVHSTPDAPVVKNLTETSIELEAQTGVLYAIEKNGVKGEYGSATLFEGLEEGTAYKIYSKYSPTSAIKERETVITTKGLVAPVLKEATHNSIKIEVVTDQEYSIDGGTTWNTTGEFTDLEDATVYTVLTRIPSAPEVTKETKVATKNEPYSFIKGSGAYYAYQIPDDVTSLNSGNGYINATVSGESYPVESFDSAKFVAIDPNGSDITASLNATKITYGSTLAGLPNELKDKTFEAYAIRVKMAGGTDGTPAIFDLALEYSVNSDSGTVKNHYNIKADNYKLIDALTGKQFTLTYVKDSGFSVTEAFDGYIIIPFDKFQDSGTITKVALNDALFKLRYSTLNVTVKGSASDWTDRKLYINNAFVLTDVDTFLLYTIAPDGIVLDNKTTTSIKVQPIEGAEYSVDKINWQTSPEFTGLTPHTYYTVYARYPGRFTMISRSWYTDIENVSLVAPQNVVATQSTVKVDIVPGLEYGIALVGSTPTVWNEDGEFAGLLCDEAYIVYARIKGQTETVETAVSTLPYPNLWLTDFDDNLTWIYEMPHTEGATFGGYGNEAFVHSYITPNVERDGNNVTVRWDAVSVASSYTIYEQTYTGRTTIKNVAKTETSYTFTVEDNNEHTYGVAVIQSPPVVKIGDEYFGKLSPNQEALKGFSPVYKSTTGVDGIPLGVNFRKQEAIVARVKVEGLSNSTQDANFTIFTDENSGGSVNMNPNLNIYYIDYTTGDPRVSTSKQLVFTEDFDGYIVIPTMSLIPTTERADGKLTVEWYNTAFNRLTYWLHCGASCKHGYTGSSWENRKVYIGNHYFAKDMELFIKEYGVADMPQYESKTTDTITLKVDESLNMSGVQQEYLYSMDTVNWQESNVFTGLTQNTEYKFYAKFKGDEYYPNYDKYSLPLVIKTDMAEPPTAAPTITNKSEKTTEDGTIILTDDEFVEFENIGGLTYAVSKTTTFDGPWVEEGKISGLEPNTEYYLIGKSKYSSDMTDVIKFKTPKVPVPPELDNGDGTIKWFIMDNYKGDWFSAFHFTNGMGYDKTTGEPKKIGGVIPIKTVTYEVKDENGNVTGTEEERMISYKVHTGTGHNFLFGGCTNYGLSRGFPRYLWVTQLYGLSIRLKVANYDNEETGINIWTNAQSQVQLPKSPIYLIDKASGTWKKVLYQTKLNLSGFDGWLMIPFSSIARNVPYDMIQERFKNVQLFSAGNWNGIEMMLGESVVVEDVDKYLEKVAPNTEESIWGSSYNKEYNPNIDAAILNDCSGSKVNEGLVAINKVSAFNKTIKRNYAVDNVVDSKAVVAYPAISDFSTIFFSNDSLSYKNLTTEIEHKVLDSTGIAFYAEVPENAESNVTFNLEIQEELTEYFIYNEEYTHYTISNGKVKEITGPISLAPGFKGYVMIPFDSLEFDGAISEFVDGLLFSPNMIGYVGFTFDTIEHPEMNGIPIILDEILLYQSEKNFITSVLKVQGAKDAENYKVIEVIEDFIYDESGLSRYMANNCTNIETDKGIYSCDNIRLSLIEADDFLESSTAVKIGDGTSAVLFNNHAFYEDMADEDFELLYNATGVSFEISVPKDAPMIVGTDLEICEDETEYYMYDASTYYYTVVDGEVTKVYGYLEFAPGFNGTVIIPFENFYLDEEYSMYDDGELYDYDLFNYFGFYFTTNYYSKIGNTTIEIDDIAYYIGDTYDYIDEIWSMS